MAAKTLEIASTNSNSLILTLPLDPPSCIAPLGQLPDRSRCFGSLLAASGPPCKFLVGSPAALGTAKKLIEPLHPPLFRDSWAAFTPSACFPPNHLSPLLTHPSHTFLFSLRFVYY